MKGKERTYFIIGLVFIAIGIFMIVANENRTMAYGDITIGICFLALSQRAKKNQ